MDERHKAHRQRIVFLATNIESIYGSELATGVSEAAAQSNIDLIMPTGRTGGVDFGFNYQHNVIFHTVGTNNVDGLIIAGATISNYLGPSGFASFLEQFSGIPLVSIGRDISQGSTIKADNQTSIETLVNHFVKHHGYRNLAWLGGPASNPDAKERRDSFLAAMERHGLQFAATNEITGSFDRVSGEAAARHIIDNLLGSIDAILVANDDMAVGLMEELGKLGIRVPDDLAVAGFDDYNASWTEPPLTTIRQPTREMGRLAVEACIALIGDPTATRSLILPSPLVIRSSCGCPPSFSNEPQSFAAADPEYHQWHHQLVVHAANFRGIAVIALDSLLGSLLSLDSNQIKELISSPVQRLSLSRAFESLIIKDQVRAPDFRFLGTCLDQLRAHLLYRSPIDPGRSDCETLVHALRSLLAEMQARIMEQHYRYRDRPNHEIMQVLGSLTDNLNSPDTMFETMVPSLRAMGIKACMIWLYPRPIAHQVNSAWESPSKIRQVLAFHDQQTTAMRSMPAPSNGDQHYLDDLPFSIERSSSFVIFPIYVREEQLGILACDFNPELTAFYERLGLEIGVGVKLTYLLGQQREIEQRLRHTLRELEHSHDALTMISTQDELTGLLNRRGFMIQGERILSMGSYTGHGGLLCYADMDGLKKINDTWGHDQGDLAIKAMATILSKTFRVGDTIARMGGDEFTVIILESEPSKGAVLQERLEQLLKSWNQESGMPWQLGITIGMIEFKAGEGLTISELLRKADSLLYERKREKSGR